MKCPVFALRQEIHAFGVDDVESIPMIGAPNPVLSMDHYIRAQVDYSSQAPKSVIRKLMLAAMLICAFGHLQAQNQSAGNKSTREASLKKSLQHYAGGEDADTETRYFVGWVDLNADGKQEAIVHLMGPY